MKGVKGQVPCGVLGQSPKVLALGRASTNNSAREFWYSLLHQIDFGVKLCYPVGSRIDLHHWKFRWRGRGNLARVQKYTKGATGKLCQHYERRTNELGEYVKFGNQDIDLSRTHLNYNLAPERETSQVGYIEHRLSEVKCLKRKDVNVMCTWAVTLPKEVPIEDSRQFFEATYDFLTERYGGFQHENVISAYVHMDESRPHMHFAFVPTVYDWEKGRDRLCAKEVISLNDLKTFHTDLERFLQDDRGIVCEVLNEATKEGNKSIRELKEGTAIKELKEIKAELVEAYSERRGIAQEVKRMYAEKNMLSEDVNRLKQDINVQKGIVSDLSERIANLKKYEPLIAQQEETIQANQSIIETQAKILPELEKALSFYDRLEDLIIDKRKEVYSLDEKGEEIRKAREKQQQNKSFIDGQRKGMDYWMGEVAKARKEINDRPNKVSRKDKGYDR